MSTAVNDISHRSSPITHSNPKKTFVRYGTRYRPVMTPSLVVLAANPNAIPNSCPINQSLIATFLHTKSVSLPMPITNLPINAITYDKV